MKRIISIALIAILILSACNREDSTSKQSDDNKIKKEFFAMDTIMDITIYGEDATLAMEEVEKLIHTYDAIFSVTDPDSDVAKLNAAGGSVVSVSKETYDLVKTSLEISEETDGLFDISIYPLVKLWGFTTDNHKVPDMREIQLALKKVDYKKIQLRAENKIQLEKNMEIDLGAVAKGYLSQQIIALLKEQGITSAIVSLGGNVQALGQKEDGSSFLVGITNPADGQSIYGTLSVEGKAVITSGIYQRYFEENGKKYHHIMDKRTGMPADNNLASVTVIAENGILADALATALLVMGEDKAKEYVQSRSDIEVIMIRKDGSFWQSDQQMSFSREQ